MSTDLHPDPAPAAVPPPPPVGPAARRALRPVVGLVLIVGSLAVALLWAAPTARVERGEATHPAVDRLVLQLDASGDVEIRVDDGQDGDVQEIIVATELRSGIGQVEVTQRVDGDDLRLTSRRCDSWLTLPWTQCSASFVITVPAATQVVGQIGNGGVQVAGVSATVEIQSGNGRIETSDTTGRLDLRTDNGEIRIDGAQGDVTVATDNGEVSVGRVAGQVQVSTGNGKVEVLDVDGAVVIVSDNGDLDVQATTGDPVQLTSGNGHIDFAPALTPTSARLHTDNGDIEVRLPDDAPPVALTTNRAEEDVDIAVATDPAAQHQLEVRTGNGAISINHR